MKKVLFIMVLVMSALVINAQTTTKTTKSTTSTTAKSAPTPVKVADLPKSITDNVAKDYAGFTIKDASSVTANNATTYHVVVMKGSTNETLVYDSNGKFVKKLGSKGSSHKTSKKK